MSRYILREGEGDGEGLVVAAQDAAVRAPRVARLMVARERRGAARVDGRAEGEAGRAWPGAGSASHRVKGRGKRGDADVPALGGPVSGGGRRRARVLEYVVLRAADEVVQVGVERGRVRALEELATVSERTGQEREGGGRDARCCPRPGTSRTAASRRTCSCLASLRCGRWWGRRRTGARAAVSIRARPTSRR